MGPSINDVGNWEGGGDRGGVKNWSKLLTDMGKGGVKYLEKLPTSLMDGPLLYFYGANFGT